MRSRSLATTALVHAASLVEASRFDQLMSTADGSPERAGPVKVITLPCRGEYSRVLSPSTLLVMEETRSDPDRYSAALGTFVDSTLG